MRRLRPVLGVFPVCAVSLCRFYFQVWAHPPDSGQAEGERERVKEKHAQREKLVVLIISVESRELRLEDILQLRRLARFACPI